MEEPPKIRSITLVRHALVSKTSKHPHTNVLSKWGKDQARHLRKQLREPSFDLVFYPPIMRMAQTARLVAGTDLAESCKKETVLDSLFFDEKNKDDPRGLTVMDARRRLDRAPLREYFTDKNVKGALLSIAEESHEAIIEKIILTNALKTLVVAPGILIPAICVQFCESKSAASSFINAKPLRKCEGFELMFGEDMDFKSWKEIR